MEIHRVGMSVPIAETPTETVAPKEPPLTPTISQPFQNDGIVAYTPPGLDLGNSQTTPAPAQMGQGSDHSWEGALHQDQLDRNQHVKDNVLEAYRNSAKDILDDIR